MNLNSRLSEEKFETHFCNQLEKQGYIQRNNKNTEKLLHLDFDLLEKFLNNTQKDEFENFKDTYHNWRPKFEQAIKNELESKELIQIIQQGITIEATYEFKLLFTKNTTTFNKDQNKLVKQNIFSYIRQYKFDTESESSIDIVLFLNGLPITTIELKYRQKGQDVYSAVEQYLRRDLHLSIFQEPFLHVAADNDNVRVATKFFNKTTKDFMPFNMDITNPVIDEEYRIQYMYNDVLTPDSILDLIRNFIFVDKNQKLIFPRYHQRRSVNKLIEDISNKFKKSNELDLKFLIEHSMGSGKSKTITWTAEKLKNLHINNKKVFNSIFIITDRRDLNKQIAEDFKLMTGDKDQTVSYVTNSKELNEAIKNEEKVIVVVIHNFKYLDPNNLINKKHNRICYLIDETHRSQDGNLNSSMTDFFEKIGDDGMEHKYPNSVFIGFTATPTDKTLQKFGKKNDEGKYESYDKYSMDQAIKEGYILDVTQNIIPFRTLYKFKKESEVKLYEKEFNALQLYKATKKKAYEDPKIISEKIKYILHYFNEKIKNEINGSAKSMIVASSRKAAIAYKCILDAEIKRKGLDIKTLVAFSGKESHKELELKNETENSLNNFNGDIAEEFQKKEYKFLIVADKYQTGFDEPLLYAMFLDKPVKGINAVQTLGRLNRVHHMKKPPITIDFSNSYEEIKTAFNKFKSSRESGIVTDYGELIDLFENIMQKEILKREYLKEFNLLLDTNEHIFQTKFEVFLNKIKNNYSSANKTTKIEFKKNIGKFSKSYNYLTTIIKIKDEDIVLLGMLSKQIYYALNNDNEVKQELKEAVENLKIEKHNLVSVEPKKVKEEKGKYHKTPTDKEIPKLTVNDILEIIEENYDAYTYSKESKKLFEEYLKSLISDNKLRKKILNSSVDEEYQTKKMVLRDLDKRLKNFLIMSPEGYKLYEKYKQSDIFENINQRAYFLLEDNVR